MRLRPGILETVVSLVCVCVGPFRQGHSCAVVGNKAYVFGGSAVAQDGSPYFHNDLYSINRKPF